VDQVKHKQAKRKIIDEKPEGRPILIPDQAIMSRIRRVLDRYEYAARALEILTKESQAGPVHGCGSITDGTRGGILIPLLLHGQPVDPAKRCPTDRLKFS
jgi:hypothetical protein